MFFCRPRTQFFQAAMRHNQHTHKATHVYVYINQLRISLNCWKPLVLDVTTIISTKRAHCFSVQSYLYKITRVHSCTPQVCTPQVSCRKSLYHAAKVCTEKAVQILQPAQMGTFQNKILLTCSTRFYKNLQDL